jgi:hypothetical protein
VAGEPAKGIEGEGRMRIGRRGFLGAGLAGAGAALISPRDAVAKSTAAARQATQGPSPVPSGGIGQLPTREAYPNLPAIPVDEEGMADTLAKLAVRETQLLQAQQGLTRKFTIDGATRPAYEWLYGAAAPGPSAEHQALQESLEANPNGATAELQAGLDDQDPAPVTGVTGEPHTLEAPEQFSISWTTFPDVYSDALPKLPEYSASLTDADSATEQLWPTIAENGFGFNLILPERVGSDRARKLRREFGSAWTRQVRSALAAGNLYVIDLGLFESLGEPQTVNGAPRFTPATVTLLARDPRSKTLTPLSILVSGSGGAGRRRYTRQGATDGAWLYALQAVKASVTLYGIWLGHVFHWHIVTAAMQMTMLNTLAADHPIRQLLAPQSKYAIPFDNVLMSLWTQIAPPTSLVTAEDFLGLANEYAGERDYFDDDPTATLKRLGLRRKDFTRKTAWDRYPVVQRLLRIWDLVEEYVDTFVGATYGSDAEVATDAGLQAWMATAASPDPASGGNVTGLPEVTSRKALVRVLRSLLYRICVHGISRLNRTSNPALTFQSNYPHCLQRTDIPSPRARLSTSDLLGYLPNTDTISKALFFYLVFAYSTPYEPFIPLDGVARNLFFPGGGDDPRNRALIDLRRGLAAFIEDYEPDMPQRYQWPLNIET